MAETRNGELTIDELARETGMTVRNIRAHQSRGLLAPPAVRARTGYYGPEHVARIRLIQELQGEGFNLKAIERLLTGARGGTGALDFNRALLSAFQEEEPEFATVADLEARLGGPWDEKLLRRAEKIDLIRPLGDGRYELPSPTMMRAGEELVALGIPVSHALAVGEQVRRHTRAIADSFVRLFVADVLEQAELPEDWPRVREALERMRPLAAEVVTAAFRQTMSRAVERQLERSVR